MARNRTALDIVVEDCKLRNTATTAEAVVVDVADEASVREFAAYVGENYRQVHHLVSVVMQCV